MNPELVAGAPGEAEVAGFVAGWCREAGLDVEVDEVAPGRPNVVAVARGRGGGRSLLLDAHTDTVGLGGPRAKARALVEGGRVYGRGAYDMKAGLAACMVTVAEAARRGLAGDVVLAAVVDEEVASIGTEAVVRAVEADAAIVPEPTDERICVAHRGFAAFEVETLGRAAHGSRPDLGVDAIAHMGHVLVGIERLDRELREEPRHPLLGSGSVHASLIEGGQEYSSYPARCVLRGERRIVPGESVEHVEEELRALLEGVDGEARVTFARAPFEVSADEPIVQALRRNTAGAEVGGAAFWADSGLLGEAGIPTVLFGPLGAGAHAEEEWVDAASVERCVGVLLATVAEFCG